MLDMRRISSSKISELECLLEEARADTLETRERLKVLQVTDLSLPLYLSLPLSLSISTSPSIYLYLSPSLSIYLSIYLYLSPSLSIYLFTSLSISPSLYLPLPPSLPLLAMSIRWCDTLVRVRVRVTFGAECDAQQCRTLLKHEYLRYIRQN